MLKKLFIWIGEDYNFDSRIYGCEYYTCIKDVSFLINLLIKAETVYDGFVIHFDGLYIDILNDLVSKGMNNQNYEVRIHDVDEEQYNIFRNYIDKHWIDQTGWFTREKRNK